MAGGPGRAAPWLGGSVKVGLSNDQFRAYADYMASDDFKAATGNLLELSSATPAAVMCAESLWWRCHRRLLADHLVLVEEMTVEHLLHTGCSTAHPVTSGARREGDRVVYDAVPVADASPDDG